MLPARMRSASGWSDACILNVSSRGLLIYSAGAAQPGNFVEVRRGAQLVVARVVWRQNRRIGLSCPDPVPVKEIISNDAAAAAAAVRVCGGTTSLERRRHPRTDDKSRARARAAEFLAVVLISTAMAGAAAVYVQQALAKPLSAVRTALGSR